ncbi:MAG: FAD-binding oxidoreductase, partial [Candidatus Binatia bacterium]
MLGAGIVLSVTAQALAGAVETIRRIRFQSLQRKRMAELLDLRLRAARQRFVEEEQKSLHWMGWRKFQVRWKRYEDPLRGISSFYLVPHDGKAIPAFEPGQFLTFQLKIAGQLKPVVRCYSLSDSAKPDYYRVSIKRLKAPPGTDFPAGISSSFFHDHVNEGDILDVRAPAGKFFLDMASERPVVLIGGGVGITPVLSMLNAIVESGSRRETWFFLGVRNKAEHPFKEHLETIAHTYENVRLRVCYSHPDEGAAAGTDYHFAERVSVELMRRLLPSNNYDFFFCGPTPMMDTLLADLKGWGVPEERIHYEKFGPGHEKKKVKAEVVPAAAAGATFEVTFVKAGKKLVWGAGAGSILE